MQEAFEKLQKAGKNNAEELISWMKDSKVIQDTKAEVDKARSLFGSEVKNVSFAKFKEVLEKLASEHKTTFDDVSKKMVAEGNKAMDKLMAGASTLKDKFFK